MMFLQTMRKVQDIPQALKPLAAWAVLLQKPKVLLFCHCTYQGVSEGF